MAEYRPSCVGEALDEYFDDISLSLTKGSVANYRAQLRKLDASLPLCDFDRRYCRQFLSSLPLNPTSVRNVHAILSIFARWLVGRGYALVDPMDGVPRPKRLDPPLKALSEPQIMAISEACQTPRERLIVAFLLGTGLRRAELCSARWEDLDGDVLRVLGKGRKYRRVLVPADVIALLGEKGSGKIIGLQPNAIWVLVKEVGQRAGLPWLSPHCLRHTWATRWMLHGGAAFHLQTLGGWTTDYQVRTRYARAALEAAALDEARRMEGSAVHDSGVAGFPVSRSPRDVGRV